MQGAVTTLTLTSIVGIAATVAPLNTFTPGTTISSSQINANFNSLKAAIEANSSQVYMGTHNASTNVDPSGTTAGEYYIISTAGTINSVAYAVGDWIIFNGTVWEKIPSSLTISSVFGRTGAISAMEGDYNLNKLLDVDTTTTPPAANDFLKFNGSTWVPGNLSESDPLVQPFAKAVLPTCTVGEVLKSNGTTLVCVTDNAGAPAFTGAINRVVTTDGAGSLQTSTVSSSELGYLSGTTSNIQTQLNGLSIPAGSMSEFYRGDKTWQVLNTMSVPEASNLYFTEARVRNTMLTGLALGDSSAITASDNVVEAFGKAQSQLSTKMAMTGGTLSVGTIGGVPNPVNPDDVVNKSYVDSLGTWATAGINFFKLAGNIGIGSSTPKARLHVHQIPLAGTISSSGPTITGSGTNFLSDFSVGDTIESLGETATISAISNNTSLTLSAPFTNTKVSASYNKTGTILNAGNVGIGTDLPTAKLEVSSTSTIGYPYVKFKSTTTGNGFNFHATSGMSILRSTAGAGLAIQSNEGTMPESIVLSQSDNSIQFMTNGAENMRITSSGNIGIGTMTPAYALHVIGTVAGTSAYMNASDVRYKKEIEVIKNPLSKLLQINGVSYIFKNEEFSDLKFSKRRELGVIAQNVEKVFPEAVSRDQNGFRSVAYSMLISPIIEAIREMNSKTSKLEAENKMLKNYLCEKDPYAPFCE